MKTVYFLLMIVLIHHQGMAQEAFSDEFKYKAMYQLTYQPDSTDASSVASEEMWLYLGDKLSRFSSRGKALKDSLSGTGSMANMANLRTMAENTKTEFDYTLYKNAPENKISYTLKILGDKLRYEDEKDLLEWEILPETGNIQGYESQKAMTEFRGREYTAWFTSEIPISDGPYKFQGLPGLILQIGDSENQYIFELTEFKRLNEPIPVELELADYTLTSREKLLRLKREFEEDPFAALDNANRGSTKRVTIHMSKKEKREQLNKIRKELEKKNNPIELE